MNNKIDGTTCFIHMLMNYVFSLKGEQTILKINSRLSGNLFI